MTYEYFEFERHMKIEREKHPLDEPLFKRGNPKE